jgi:hypothetical protein
VNAFLQITDANRGQAAAPVTNTSADTVLRTPAASDLILPRPQATPGLVAVTGADEDVVPPDQIRGNEVNPRQVPNQRTEPNGPAENTTPQPAQPMPEQPAVDAYFAEVYRTDAPAVEEGALPAMIGEAQGQPVEPATVLAGLTAVLGVYWGQSERRMLREARRTSWMKPYRTRRWREDA